LTGTPTLGEGLESLLRLAYHRGSDDNITLVGCEFGKMPRSRGRANLPPPIPHVRRTTARSHVARRLVAAVLAGLLVAAIAVMAMRLGDTVGQARHVPLPRSAAAPNVQPAARESVAGDQGSTASSPPETTLGAVSTPDTGRQPAAQPLPAACASDTTLEGGE
jgi:hypothetical protein